jgi:hypothetical protein
MLRKFTTFLTISGICTLDLVNFQTKPILAQTRSDTCIQGYVWREATPNDRVCVTPEIRTQTAEDNSAASSRIDPVDRTYGPFTCVQGYVWRETIPNDLVCVTPEVRSQAVADNSQASSRRVRVRFQPGRVLTPDRVFTPGTVPILKKATVLPPNPTPYQFLGISKPFSNNKRSSITFANALALRNALDNARKYLSNAYGDRNLALNYRLIKKDEGFVADNKWMSWVIIEIIANPDYNPSVDCPQPVNQPGEEQLGKSCSPLPNACYFKDPRNCPRRK